MEQVDIVCSRCKQKISGYVCEELTCGFYKVDKGMWSEFVNSGERFLCDNCMHTDPRYVVMYGKAEANG